MVIELSGVCKVHGHRIGVRDISFAVDRGEKLYVLGPSGSGKTTLLRLIAGLDAPTGGVISIGGRLASSSRIMVRPSERNIAMVFQNLALWPHLTAAGNVEFCLKKLKLSRRERKEQARGILDRVGLAKESDLYPSQLSGGAQQRLAIARAIALQPNILLLDEPLSSLDPHLADDIKSLLCDVREQLNATQIYVTHAQQQAFAEADRIGILNEGRLQQLGAPNEVLENPSNDFVRAFIRVSAV